MLFFKSLYFKFLQNYVSKKNTAIIGDLVNCGKYKCGIDNIAARLDCIFFRFR